MDTAVYYFTRTGVSESVAKHLAAKLGGKTYKIEDKANWAGPLGYIKAGFCAVRKKSMPALYREPLPEERVVLVMPLWAGTFPPAVRSFVSELSRERIFLIVTSKGSTLSDREGFAKVVDAVGNPPKMPEL